MFSGEELDFSVPTKALESKSLIAISSANKYRAPLRATFLQNLMLLYIICIIICLFLNTGNCVQRDRAAWLMRPKDSLLDAAAENLLDRLEVIFPLRFYSIWFKFWYSYTLWARNVWYLKFKCQISIKCLSLKLSPFFPVWPWCL